MSRVLCPVAAQIKLIILPLEGPVGFSQQGFLGVRGLSIDGPACLTTSEPTFGQPVFTTSEPTLSQRILTAIGTALDTLFANQTMIWWTDLAPTLRQRFSCPTLCQRYANGHANVGPTTEYDNGPTKCTFLTQPWPNLRVITLCQHGQNP